MSLKVLKKDEYASLARKMVAEGCVLLKNDNNALPIKAGQKVAVFGRCAFNYYKSGLGSGGMVNTSYVVSILDALCSREDINLNSELIEIYKAWIEKNPYEKGQGWGKTPWSQKEMPITSRMEAIARDTDVAIVIIGRTAGEDQDNHNREGSYRLTETELELIDRVSKACEKTVILFNVGNIIDMSWAVDVNAALLYVWQGGQEGGNGVVDVLMGDVTPAGRLATTVTNQIENHPSDPYFGSNTRNFYKEDIYVGFRYFETFDAVKNQVMYPFGYGLSYTSFDKTVKGIQVEKDSVKVELVVKNTGKYSGKETAIVYIEAPAGKLNKPKKVMAGFGKTRTLSPGEETTLYIVCKMTDFASYDDSGKSGHQFAWILEKGSYQVYLGGDIRSAALIGSFELEDTVIEELEQALAPRIEFERMAASGNEDGTIDITWEQCPLSIDSVATKLEKHAPFEIPVTGDKGYRLEDVAKGNTDIKSFVAQLSDKELVDLFHGEGMCSSQATPGIAACFGGVTADLKTHGIPIAGCADGPSGIRMDCGTKAFSLPNGAAIASSFNVELAEELFEMVGLELRKNKIDAILGPGINIIRHPLNGRNFEYFSEDPILTGKMCAAELRGLHKCNVTGAIKHFAANNQETDRSLVDSVVSERALREIYLRPYEIAVREGDANCIMTSYNPVNGVWAAANFELNTLILRKQWGFKGMVMSDWWAKGNWPEGEADRANRAPIAQSGNDVYMCCQNSEEDLMSDNCMECLEKGQISRADLQRNAVNLLEFLISTPAMDRLMGVEEELLTEGFEEDSADDEAYLNMKTFHANADGIVDIEIENVTGEAGKSYIVEVEFNDMGVFEMELTYSSVANSLAQLPISIYMNNFYATTISVNGTDNVEKTVTKQLRRTTGKKVYYKFQFGSDGLELKHMRFIPVEEQDIFAKPE